MNTTNGIKDGVPTAPPDPPPPVDDDPEPPTPPLMSVDESHVTKFNYQAKIDVNRNHSNNTPLRLKALLTELLLKHQLVDPAFQFLPTEEGPHAGAITKASDIPNSEA
jgi:hypothetical protein